MSRIFKPDVLVYIATMPSNLALAILYRKWCFMGHQRLLDGGHKFRISRIQFGEEELHTPPRLLLGVENFSAS